MNQVLIKEEKFSFIEIGEGQPIVLLHGLMWGLSNFEGILNLSPINDDGRWSPNLHPHAPLH